MSSRRLTSAACETKLELLGSGRLSPRGNPADRDKIYRLRYRAYLNEGAIEPTETSESPIVSTKCRTPGFSASTMDGALASSIRLSIRRRRCASRLRSDVFTDFLQPELDRGKIMVDPTRFVADPDPAGRIPELPYLTVRLGYVACSISTRTSGWPPFAPNTGRSIGVYLHETAGAAAPVSWSDQADLSDGGRFSGRARKGLRTAIPYLRSSAFERRMLFERAGTGTLVRTECRLFRARLDRPEVLISDLLL